jgi:virginiamycin B lyase
MATFRNTLPTGATLLALTLVGCSAAPNDAATSGTAQLGTGAAAPAVTPLPPPLALADPLPQCHALPDARSGPTTVTITPAGQIWFTQSAGNRIGRMNPDGSDLQEFPLPHTGSQPRIIALGGDGNLWFSEHLGSRISRLTPDGQYTGFDLPTPDSQPRAIALSADGNIWAGQFAAARVARVTPQGQITEFPTPTPDSGPRALAAGPDGNVWFSEYRANRIARITPDGHITEFELPRPNSGPGDITAGTDGAMWFVELSGGMDGLRTDGNRVGRITMDGQITEYAMPASNESPVNIALGPDHRLWYTRGHTLGRVNADGSIDEFPMGENVRAVGLSAGADRQPPRRLDTRLWFADGGGGQICYLVFR